MVHHYTLASHHSSSTAKVPFPSEAELEVLHPQNLQPSQRVHIGPLVPVPSPDKWGGLRQEGHLYTVYHTGSVGARVTNDHHWYC